MKKTVLIIIILFQTNFVLSQGISNSEIMEFEISKVKSFDGEGNLEMIKVFNQNGQLSRIFEIESEIQREFIYTHDKQLLKEIISFSNGKIHNSIKYYYNSKNQLAKKEQIDSDGEINYIWTFEYNENNQLIKKNQNLKLPQTLQLNTNTKNQNWLRFLS